MPLILILQFFTREERYLKTSLLLKLNKSEECVYILFMPNSQNSAGIQ